ncbi:MULTISPECIES: type II secretion system F family protein [unclassified Marinobacter]|uniref:type II secretion system F family protein n=1 Tax=unclassified Marinobacter TaxID=83889 RepID=UPI00273A9380|nr:MULTISPECIES: type II secretion system F family protein [unclassified Marinobacter]MDP4548539.1 type II secretion system F family protein [Marinobacter sp. MDS2]
MNVQILWLGALGLGFLAVVVVLLQFVVGYYRGMANLQKQSLRRLAPQDVVEEKTVAGIRLGPIEQLMIKAGIQASVSRMFMLLVVLLSVIAAIVVVRGLLEAIVAVIAFILIAVTLWRVKFERMRRQIFEELPGIVDAVLRSLSAGRSVEQSMLVAFDDASEAFEPLCFRLRGAISQGRDYTLVLDGFADLYSIPPLTQMAIALRTSARFGSPVRPVLQEVSKAIRSREELRREFMAATAETRFTAIVFAIMPPGLGAYVVLMNEEFSEALLNTAAGHTMMMTAGVLQVVGTVLVWNLIRGVGRG